MLYMVVETFRDGDPVPIYRRLRQGGRMMPEGLKYVASWIEEEMHVCWQLMETDDRALLDQWIANWRDLMDFEVHRVLTSQEVQQRMSSKV